MFYSLLALPSVHNYLKPDQKAPTLILTIPKLDDKLASIQDAPSAWIHIFLHLIHCCKQLSYSDLDMYKSCCDVLSSIRSISSKILYFPRCSKLVEEGSATWDHIWEVWWLTHLRNVAKNCCTSWDKCASALL